MPRRYPMIYRGVRYEYEVPEASMLELSPSEIATHRGTQGRQSSPVKRIPAWPKKTVPIAVPTRQFLPIIHRDNLQRNLDRRLRVARAHNNIALVALLEIERQQLLEL